MTYDSTQGNFVLCFECVFEAYKYDYINFGLREQSGDQSHEGVIWGPKRGMIGAWRTEKYQV